MSSLVQKKNEPLAQLTDKHKELEAAMALKEKQYTQLEESLSKTTKERDELQSRHQTEMTDLKQQLDGELSKA